MAGIVTVLDEGLGNSSYVVDLGDRRALVLEAASSQPGAHRSSPRPPAAWSSPTAASPTGRRSTWAG